MWQQICRYFEFWMIFIHVFAETVLSCIGALAAGARQWHLLAVFFTFVSLKPVVCLTGMFTVALVTFKDMSTAKS